MANTFATLGGVHVLGLKLDPNRQQACLCWYIVVCKLDLTGPSLRLYGPVAHQLEQLEDRHIFQVNSSRQHILTQVT